jgi:RNA recognition motif-containing protein
MPIVLTLVENVDYEKMNLKITNLPLDVDNTELKNLFEPYGEIESAEVIYDRYNGYSKGLAFVKMKSFASGLEAIKNLNGKEIKGQKLVVQEKQVWIN